MKKLFVALFVITPLAMILLAAFAKKRVSYENDTFVKGSHLFEQEIRKRYAFTSIKGIESETLRQRIRSELDLKNASSHASLTGIQEEELARRLLLFLKAYDSGKFEDYRVFRYPVEPSTDNLHKFHREELDLPDQHYALPADFIESVASKISPSKPISGWPFEKRLRLNFQLRHTLAINSRTLICSNCFESVAFDAFRLELQSATNFLSAQNMFTANPSYGSRSFQPQFYVLEPSIENVVKEDGQVLFARVYFLIQLQDDEHVTPVAINLYWVDKYKVWFPIEIVRSNSGYPIRFVF